MSFRLALPVTLVLGATLGAFAQQRIKPKGVVDFDTLYAAVGQNWKESNWGQCYVGARDLLGVISQRRAQAIREAMPNPEGYTRNAVPENDAQATAMLAAMTAGVGNVIQQEYDGPGGKHLRLTVTADSPMLAMFRMVLDNPAMLQKNQELVKYTEGNALVETQGDTVTLRILFGDTMVEGEFQGADADHALSVMTQQAVTALHQAISR